MNPSRLARALHPAALRPAAGLCRNDALRDEILGVASARYAGGVKPFAGLDVGRLQKLFDAKLIDPLSRRGAGPPAWQFLRYMRRWPAATASGCAVSRRRKDYGVVLEGLEVELSEMREGAADRARWEFEQLCRGADEYADDGARISAWWDCAREAR